MDTASGMRTETPFRYREKQPTIWFHSALEKSNHWCPYCARFLADGVVPSDKEHLIGRSFVPVGSFGVGQAFNFIFRACTECNREKAGAERHISSVTLFSSPGRTDEVIDALAKRKASRDYHPIERGKLVSEALSAISLKIAGPSFGASLRLLGPPQLDRQRVRLLAIRHIQGLFSLVTTRDALRADQTRLLPPEHCWIGGYFPHSDWGNAWLAEVARRTSGWRAPARISSANGFFKAVLKRDEDATGQWFWALEWNKSLRIIGGIAGQDSEPKLFDSLPALGWQVLASGIRRRRECPLATDDDHLFDVHE